MTSCSAKHFPPELIQHIQPKDFWHFNFILFIYLFCCPYHTECSQHDKTHICVLCMVVRDIHSNIYDVFWCKTVAENTYFPFQKKSDGTVNSLLKCFTCLL